MPMIWDSALWPRFVYDATRAAPALARAQEALGEVRGLAEGLDPEALEQFSLRQIVAEAVASFGIEGVSLNRDEIEASVIASLRHRDRHALSGRRPDGIAALMLAAREADGPLTAAMLQDWHRLLFAGVEIEDRGRWRSFALEIVRSASAGPGEVLYTAPPPERLAAEMAVFLDWLARPIEMPLPVTAAIAHLWFESIHPFSDGNGRIGRALIEHVFAQSRALPFSLSRQIERDKRGYYAALQAARRPGQGGIEATPFVIWFLDTLAGAAETARAEAMFLLRRNGFFLRHGAALSPRQRKALEVLFAQGPARLEEGLSARSYRKITGASSATATRDLAELERIGAVERSGAGGRSVSYLLVLQATKISSS